MSDDEEILLELSDEVWPEDQTSEGDVEEYDEQDEEDLINELLGEYDEQEDIEDNQEESKEIEEEDEEEEILLELSDEDQEQFNTEESNQARNKLKQEQYSNDSTAIDFEMAKKNLQISEPSRIVGRATEVKNIRNFVISALQLAKNQNQGKKKQSNWERADILQSKTTGTGGRCLYISGMPGTGKTSTLVHLLRKLQDDWDENEEYPDFDWMFINARKISNPQRLMSVIYKNCKGEKKGAITATAALETLFSEKGDPIIVVLDEIDFLISRSQKELYTLVDWPSKPRSRLIVIGIANTLDLPERLLMPRIASRFGKTTISFAPYSEAQLMQLLESRVKQSSAFHPDAISFCAKSVASSFGDARRVLHLARQALEIAKQQKHITVQMIDVHRAITQMGSLAPTEPIKQCSVHEQLVLYAIVCELRFLQVEYVEFSKVSSRYFSLCDANSIRKASYTEVSAIVHQLSQQRLIIASHGQFGVQQKIQLYYTVDEVLFALSSCTTQIGEIVKK